MWFSAPSESNLERTHHKIDLLFPNVLTDVLNRLGQGWLTGGAIRDALLGKTTQDYDIATPVRFDRFVDLFPSLWIKAVLPNYGCIKLQIKNVQIDITMYRKEGVYKDHRRPSRIYATTRGHDAVRRDVTMNALYYDPRSHTLVDSVGGISDLMRMGWVRAIRGQESFEEDYLRILRVLRFTFQCGLILEPKTAQAMQDTSHLVRHIHPDRVRSEISKCLQVASISQVMQRMHSCKVIEALMGFTPDSRFVKELGVVLQPFGPQSLETFMTLLGFLYGRQLSVEARMDQLSAALSLIPMGQKPVRHIKKAYIRLSNPNCQISNFRPSKAIQAILAYLSTLE